MRGFVLASAQYGQPGVVVLGNDHTADLAHETQGDVAFGLDPCVQVFEGCQPNSGRMANWILITISNSNSRLA